MKQKRSWVIGDTHFSHKGIVEFHNFDGSKLRPWTEVNEMDEALIDNWNSVVDPIDTVYHLGDIAFSKSGLELIRRLAGRKIAILGNHDKEKISRYVDLFADVRAIDVRKQYGRKFVMSHVPVHPDCLDRWGLNIHGHTHANRIKLPSGSIDNRFFCASVEQINYTPKLLEQVLSENPL